MNDISERCETVNIKRGDDYFRINATDYDKKKHGATYSDEDVAAAAPARTAEPFAGTNVDPVVPAGNTPVTDTTGKYSVTEAAGKFFIVTLEGVKADHMTWLADGYNSAPEAIEAIKQVGFEFVPQPVSGAAQA